MKKVLFLMGAMLTISTASIAQTPVGQGNIIIDPYIGFPNWNNVFAHSGIAENHGDGNGHLNGGQLSYGGRVEYLLADNFGIGIDFNYEVSGYGYGYMSNEYNEATMVYDYVAMNYEYKEKISRIMLRLNYHLVQNDRVDAYAGFAAGYKNLNKSGVRTRVSTGVETEDTDLLLEEDLFPIAFPVAFRLAVGARMYLTDNIGAHVELGAFGGGLIQLGISAKY